MTRNFREGQGSPTPSPAHQRTPPYPETIPSVPPRRPAPLPRPISLLSAQSNPNPLIGAEPTQLVHGRGGGAGAGAALAGHEGPHSAARGRGGVRGQDAERTIQSAR